MAAGAGETDGPGDSIAKAAVLEGLRGRNRQNLPLF